MDSDDSDFELPKMDGLSESDDDPFADVFKPKKKATYDESIGGDGTGTGGYVPQGRSHVCDECEGVFTEAVFCGECSMTYCLPCDSRYHSSGDELGLRNHFRQPLHGEIPRALQRQMIELQKEEEEDAQEQVEKNTRESIYRDDARHRADRIEQQRASEEKESNILSSMPPASAFSSTYAGLDLPSQSIQHATSSSPLSVTFNPVTTTATTAQSWFGSGGGIGTTGGYVNTQFARPSGTSQTKQRSPSATRSRPKIKRPASAAPGGNIARTTMVLQSARPPSATLQRSPSPSSRSKVQVKTLPTRMGVSSSSTTLAGKTAFGKNMLLHSTSAAMIHQVLPGKKQPTKGNQGAHNAKGQEWGQLPKDALVLRELNQQIMSLKTEISQLQTTKGQYKTAVLKKQRALKEISRIATNLAKQPNVSSSLSQNRSTNTKLTSDSKLSGAPADLREKIQSIRTSNEILRLEIEQQQAKITVLKDSARLKDQGSRELSNLSRERSALIKQVSIDQSGRELDLFKKEQMLADLQFAIDEMKKTVEVKKKQVGETKLQRMQAENTTRSLESEYHQLQGKLDRWAQREVTQQAQYA